MAQSKTGKLIGYARVSTDDQSTEAQAQALKSAGCAEIHEEQGSGGNRARPVLARLVERIAPGQTLVVVRIDRLARSLSHLLKVIEKLEAKGAFFRSLVDLTTRLRRRASSPSPERRRSKVRWRGDAMGRGRQQRRTGRRAA